MVPKVEEFKYLGVLFLRGKWNYRLTNGMVPVSQSGGKALNISVNIYLYQVVTLTYVEMWVVAARLGLQIHVAETNVILKVFGLSLRTSSDIQEELGRPMLLCVEKSYWKQIGYLLRVPRKVT